MGPIEISLLSNGRGRARQALRFDLLDYASQVHIGLRPNSGDRSSELVNLLRVECAGAGDGFQIQHRLVQTLVEQVEAFVHVKDHQLLSLFKIWLTAKPCHFFPGVLVGTPALFRATAMASKLIPSARKSFMRAMTSASPARSPYGLRPSQRPVRALMRWRAPRSLRTMLAFSACEIAPWN